MGKRVSQKSLPELAEAFAIFARYSIATHDYETRECLWGTTDGDVCIDIDPAAVSDDDKKRLLELGWREDEYYTFCFNTHLAWVYDD